MISKTEFVKSMKEIEDQLDFIDSFGKIIGADIIDGPLYYPLIRIIKLTAEHFKDKVGAYEEIDWFIWDLNFGKVSEDELDSRMVEVGNSGKKYYIKDAEALYDYLMEEYAK